MSMQSIDKMDTPHLVAELLARWEQYEDDSLYEAAQERGEETVHPFLLALQERGDRSVYEAARKLIRQPDRDKRLAGLTILRELGPPDARPIFPETWELWEELARSEQDSLVLREVLKGLGKSRKPRALQTLISFADSLDSELRFVVANHLLGCAEQLDDPVILSVLTKLARDSDEEVRWAALWEINEYLPMDSDSIRSLLSELQADPNPEVRELAQEALLKSQGSYEPNES